MSICHPEESYPPDYVKARGRERIPDELFCRYTNYDFVGGSLTPMSHHPVRINHPGWKRRKTPCWCICCDGWFSEAYAAFLDALEERRRNAWYGMRLDGTTFDASDPLYDEFFEVTYQ